MSYLLVFILIFTFIKNGSLSSVLNSVDIDGIKDTLKGLGIENSLLDNVSSDTVNKVLSGDFKTLLPLIPSIIGLFNKNDNNYTSSESKNVVLEELNPIKDIANDKIINSFGSYFN